MQSEEGEGPEAPPAPPRFTSDVTRGYFALGVALVPTVTTPFVLVAAGYGGQKLLTVCALFVAWIVLTALLTLLPAIVFGRAEGGELARWLAATTPPRGERLWWSINGGGAVSWAITGSFVAVASVIGVSRDAELRSETVVVALAVLVVLGSLLVTISAFAVQYARENAVAGGAEFASPGHPRFEDFVYMAIQVGTTFSTSDVTVTTTAMRNIVSLNSLIAFLFNTVIIALLVSVLVSSVT